MVPVYCLICVNKLNPSEPHTSALMSIHSNVAIVVSIPISLSLSLFQVHPCLPGIQAGCQYYLTCTD